MGKRRFGLQAEVVVSIALLMGAALLFSGLLILKIAETQILDQRLAGASLVLQTTARALAPDLAQMAEAPSGSFEDDHPVLLLPAQLGATAWQILDRDLAPLVQDDRFGRLMFYKDDLGLARYGEGPLFSVSYSTSLLPFAGSADNFAVLTLPVRHEGQRVATMQALFPLDDVSRQLLEARRVALIYVGLYGAILALFGMFLLRRNVIRPVRMLIESTRQVAEGNLEHKLSEDGPREIAELAGAFNTMTEALSHSRAQTEANIEVLERTNRDLQQARRELILSEKMASVGHLAAGMGHEIGNPLGAIIGYLGFLKQELPEGREADVIGRSLEEAERINRLVKDLLDYAAPGRSEGEWLDPSAVARDACDILRSQGGWKDRRLAVDLPEGLPAVFIPRHKLLQVFVNLLLNARDATSADGEVRISGGTTDQSVWIAVADNGTGMAPEVKANIFDPFFTTKFTGKGRGLGLSVSHRIIDEAAGRIDVESEPGRGSVFTVWLKQQG